MEAKLETVPELKYSSWIHGWCGKQGKGKDADSAPGGESHTDIWVEHVLSLPIKLSRYHSLKGRLGEMAGNEVN